MSEQTKEIEKAILNFIDKRDDEIKESRLSEKKWKNYYYFSYLFIGFVIIRILGFYFYEDKYFENSINLIREIQYLISSLAFNRVAYHISKYPNPESDIDFDNWYWKRGRKIYTYGAIFIFCLTINQIIASEIGNPITKKIAYGTVFSIIAFSVCVGLIVKKPIRITNPKIVAVGNASISLAFITIPLMMVIYGVTLINYILIFIGFILLLYASVLIFYNYWKKPKINPTIYAAINIIHPEKILNDFKTHYEKLSDQLKAIQIIKKLEKKRQFGVQIALVNILTEKYSKNTFKIGGLLFSLLIFILGSISEGLIQDLVNDNIKDFFCKYLKMYCE